MSTAAHHTLVDAAHTAATVRGPMFFLGTQHTHNPGRVTRHERAEHDALAATVATCPAGGAR